MNKAKIQLAEILLVFLIAIVTVVTQPPLPLLAIPFLIIIAMRSVCFSLENGVDRRDRNAYEEKLNDKGGKNGK